MTQPDVAIIVPVWNNPASTRECLAAVLEHACQARLILIDLGSDPETEQLLHEFADYLDERAILIRSERALGFVEAVNMGLARSGDCLKIVVRTSSRVMPGWLEPLLEAAHLPDAGVLVPRIDEAGPQRDSRQCPSRPFREVAHGSFAAIGITATLYENIGGLDGGLDGDVWCLKDYSRRAEKAGFHTVSVNESRVVSRGDISYGSILRRDKILKDSIRIYHERWGEERDYFLHLASDCAGEVLERVFSALLTRARHGRRFHVCAPHVVYRELLASGRHLAHGGISVMKLPRFFPARAARKAYERLRESNGQVRLVGGAQGLSDFVGEEHLQFADLENGSHAVEV